ncbi:hypothetical protein [Lacticaseibacillus porcinae]|uniref:hypothetical protein n=1 Tax=Lacticaseibacillus porcinae TaxID=1123687 RepID=UPI000F766994|nr:hypothetical protein [Lacticaseibacillus porcinae]
MKRRYFAICLVIELAILLLFHSQLGDTIPMQLSMFTGSEVMTASYAGGIMVPAALFLLAIHVAGFGLQSLVPIIQAKTSLFADIGAKLLRVFSVYLEIFSVVLMFYFFDSAIKGILLSAASFSLLAVVLLELFASFKATHVSQHH